MRETKVRKDHQDSQSRNGRRGLWPALRRLLVGRPRDISDTSVFHHISLVAFLAWVGLGADGLSSSAYGPAEAFRTLGDHSYLAVILALVMAGTILIISRAYSRIIEEFPHGGGGYVVATKLLGARVGVVSGCALLVDYILTITTSVAAAGDALFSFLPFDPSFKLPFEVFSVLLLTALNIRGVRESVLALMPIFLLFILTHAALIGGGVMVKVPELGALTQSVLSGFKGGLSSLGLWGMARLFLHAYSLGGGTYTGIEAVSNGLPIMRAPQVQTGKRTMLYMALSLAFTASGLVLCYLLWKVPHVEGKTMNAVLVERVTSSLPGGSLIVALTLLSEGALLVVAAQAGFIDGPRVLANMAIDSWVPRRFAALSDRLTTQNGIVLMGSAALCALLYTGGDVQHLVVMYSINVFLTFSLSTFAMMGSWFRSRGRRPEWKGRTALFASSFCLCSVILVITTMEKFREGGWVTLCVTAALVLLCFLIHAHYRKVSQKLNQLYALLEEMPPCAPISHGEPDPSQRTAGVLVAGYGGVGIHTVLNLLRTFPGDYKNLIFLSVGVIDSGSFKGKDEIDSLKAQTEEMLKKYLELARGLGLAAAYRFAVGTDVVAEAEKLCLELTEDFPRVTFFIGKVIFKDEAWYHHILHNDTAFSVQKRLEWAGKPMVILPARIQ